MRFLIVGLLAVVVIASVVVVLSALTGNAASVPSTTSRPASQPAEKIVTQKAMFGAGCFWGVEETFRTTPGVVATSVGYSGGKTKNPTYEDVCSDETGHVEVVLVEFDPAKTSYEKLLDVFFGAHDPTQVNRQGPDHGTQYRTVVFYYSPEQQKAAEAKKAALDASAKFKRKIATAIEPAKEYWIAEEYHQKYLFKRGVQVCH